MIVRALLIRLPALLLAPLLVLAALSVSGARFTCKVTGVARATCCCAASAFDPPSSTPRVQRDACCDVDVIAHVAPTSSAGERAPVAVAATWSTVTAAALAPPVVVAQAVVARPVDGPRSTAGPPLYVRHRAFLL